MDGRIGKVVLVGPRAAPKGAVLVLTSADGSSVETRPLAGQWTLLAPDQVIDVLCMQERVFGGGRLAPPDAL